MKETDIDISKLYASFLNIPFSNEMAEGFLSDEDEMVQALLDTYDRHYSHYEIAKLAQQLIEFSRENHSPIGLELLLQEYPLSSTEGLVLMNLAEALLRIPDKATALLLTKEQFTSGHWEQHLSHNDSWFVNFSTWGVLLSDKLLKAADSLNENPAESTPELSIQRRAGNIFSEMTARLGEQSILSAVHFAVSFLSRQFVIGETINEALINSQDYLAQDYHFTYDMLGEEAITYHEADAHFKNYKDAIIRLAETGAAEEFSASISIKLSALHPRFEYRQKERVYREVFERLMQLCLLAKEHQVAITIDAEEVARFEMTLVLLQMLFAQVELKGWNQLGIAVQTYQKRAPLIIEHLLSLAKSYNKIIPVRLVKGAYWDYEIKNAQQKGLRDFPVFTKKENTELCYLHCIEKLFAEKQYFFPQFATHNTQTIATVYYYAQKYNAHDFEFQRLYGMGNMVFDGLYHLAEKMDLRKVPCRIYAPVGKQKKLLPYLVRRLLENGANNSFVNQLHNPEVSPEELIINLRECYKDTEGFRNPQIPQAINLFPERVNSMGMNLESSLELKLFIEHFGPFLNKQWQACSLITDVNIDSSVPQTSHHNTSYSNRNPATGKEIGNTRIASEDECRRAMKIAQGSFVANLSETLEHRTNALRTLSELIEYNRYELIALLIKEAGKTLADAQDEVREAVDFCRYYANCAAHDFSSPLILDAYTGEENQLLWEGRGVFVCISPWNYPLSIFIGQISAALIAGNSVIAKPASATPLIAYKVIKLMYLAGFDERQLQLLLAPAELIETIVLPHPALSGVAFTGSFATARKINRVLSNRDGGIIPLIAETGGVNVMMTDSSALSEQVVKDIVISAFGCAGQRCSALRVAYIQDEVYDAILKQLSGAINELKVSDPLKFSTDMGPLINAQAVHRVNDHIETMREKGFPVIVGQQRKLKQKKGQKQRQAEQLFILPTIIEINFLDDVPEEVFGPVLHVIRYKIDEWDRIMEQVNHSGYGLTFGIHSRIPSRMEKMAEQSFSGNVYINRNMVGAVVGVQPFGGQGLSGTGPKAGGPNYLKRFAREKSICLNSVSIGGNIKLFS